MLLDLSKLHGTREHFDRTFAPSAFDPQDDEYSVAASVEVSFDVEKRGADVYGVGGRFTTRLAVACSRCAEPFEVPVSAAFDLRYVPDTQNAGEGESEVAEDDLSTAYYHGGMLDVTDLLREQFVLALPMKPLCTEDCHGLCPQCGVNLNKTQCDCAPAWEDPRLAPLKTLLSRQKEN